ncbi:MAG: LptF/LptG family permease [bacterium]
MILKKYILSRFFKYLFTINIALTFLFNFIEFFEKTIRIKHATISTILHYIMLNLPPSFFQNLNVSIWLATCLLLKEFAEQNEWETFKILNINYQKLFHLFLYTGIIISLFAFIGKENLTLPLLNESEKFKFEKLKQTSFQKIHNKWLELKTTDNKYLKTFSFFQFLDLKENTGTNLILININKDFKVEKIISSKKFKVDLQNKVLKLKKAISVNTKENVQ